MKLEDVKVGMWVRDTLQPYAGPAFVTDVKDGTFSYHLAFPHVPHASIPSWVVGGTTCYPDSWEPCDDPRKQWCGPQLSYGEKDSQ
jgi:hypothetical protein